MNAVPMIRTCHERQHPEDYGRPEIPPEPQVYGPGDAPVTGFSTYPVNEYCPRCDVNHGIPWSIVTP